MHGSVARLLHARLRSSQRGALAAPTKCVLPRVEDLDNTDLTTRERTAVLQQRARHGDHESGIEGSAGEGDGALVARSLSSAKAMAWRLLQCGRRCAQARNSDVSRAAGVGILGRLVVNTP